LEPRPKRKVVIEAIRFAASRALFHGARREECYFFFLVDFFEAAFLVVFFFLAMALLPPFRKEM